MEAHELLGKVNKVGAPPGFEGRVMAGIGQAKRARARRRAISRYAFAGSAAVLLVGFILLNPHAAGRRSGLAVAGKGRAPVTAVRYAADVGSPLLEAASTTAYLPVLETVDYSSEMRNASNQPRTVYILEQVSEDRATEIKY